MQKLVPFLFVLILVACEKGEDNVTPITPDLPAVTANCVLTEVIFTRSTTENADIQKSKTVNTYNTTTGRLEHRQSYTGMNASNWVENGHLEYRYNDKGFLEQEDFFRADNELYHRFNYEYDSNGLLIRQGFRKADVNMEEMMFITYDYISETELKEVKTQEWPYSTPLRFTFEYKDKLMRKVLAYNRSGELDYTIELEYDNKKGVVTPDYTYHLRGVYVGFPFQHNISKMTVKIPTGEVRMDSYTATFEYNTEGYPTKETRTYADGTYGIKTFKYLCK